MAVALQADDRGDLNRADEHHRRSIELDPSQVKWRGDAGLLAVRLGRTEEGLALLRKAVEEAPADVDALRKLVKGLRLSGLGEEARSAIRAGLFRNPRDARFRRLWRDYEFQQLRRRQVGGRRARAAGDASSAPVLLPFRRPAPEVPAEEANDLPRQDGPTTLAPPHAPRAARRPDQRHIQ
jgi:tetratricopeptide (TPR) repeat protein